eukprot:scaffold3351_cov242-Pinguiococcus_pyrenoidosus.AAC.4
MTHAALTPERLDSLPEGPNGAGKSTLLNMITGWVYTSGHAASPTCKQLKADVHLASLQGGHPGFWDDHRRGDGEDGQR